MRSAIFAVLAALGAATLLTTVPAGCTRSSSEQHATIQYHCPMHPTVVADTPGDCPICGMKLVPMDKSGNHEAKDGEKSTRKALYRSTMNPREVSDQPGKDSMGMDMVPVESTPEGGMASSGLAPVSITPSARERMGLTLGTIVKRPLIREIRTSARIVPDETRLYHVTVKTDGYVERLFAATTGEFVKEGEPLLTVYSPMLVSAQQEYLNVLRDNAELAAAARQRLQLWDFSDAQVDRLTRSGKPERVVTLAAPASGWIIERNLSAGHKVTAGEVLLVLGDLSSVWADSDIYQSDLPFVKMGMPVNLTISAVPEKTFSGKVTFIAPVLDAGTRTVRVRMEIPNAELLLKPEMYAVARLSFELGERLAIPEAAVMRTGERVYAFRDTGDGTLAPTDITLGARADGWFELLGGLNEGDRVVTSANFLVDSESSMKAALEALSGK